METLSKVTETLSEKLKSLGSNWIKETPQLSEKTVSIKGDYSSSDITSAHNIVMMECMCYLKNHFFKMACGDKLGTISSWHNKVTKPNLDQLIPFLNEMGLSIPFHGNLEEREQQLKKKNESGVFSGTFTEGEALLILKEGAAHAVHTYAHAYTHCVNPNLRSAFKDVLCRTCDQFETLKQTMAYSDNYYPSPIVKTVNEVGSHLGVHSRS